MHDLLMWVTSCGPLGNVLYKKVGSSSRAFSVLSKRAGLTNCNRISVNQISGGTPSPCRVIVYQVITPTPSLPSPLDCTPLFPLVYPQGIRSPLNFSFFMKLSVCRQCSYLASLFFLNPHPKATIFKPLLSFGFWDSTSSLDWSGVMLTTTRTRS